MLNSNKIRKDFPILKRRINGKPLVYLDSAASSLKPRSVISSMTNYYQKFGVNIFRGLYQISQEATEEYEKARQKVAEFLGVKDVREIIFTRNATEAINLVAVSWAKDNLQKGDEIITTIMEHHANFVTWQQLAQEKQAKIHYLDIDENGKLQPFDFAQGKNAKLFALTHVSNVLGTINPIKEIVKKVKQINPKCLVLVDGAQAIPHLKVNVQDLGCDFYAFSAHKMLGPTGIGVLWGRYELLKKMLPYQFGGEMIREVYREKTIFSDPPLKFEAGTPNIAGAIGLGAAIDYLEKIGMEKVREHEIELTTYALGYLSNLSNIEIYGPKKARERGGVIAFNIKGIHSHDLSQILNEDNICIRSGHHCAMPLHTRLKIPGSARLSFYLYNTKEEIDKLIEGIQKAKRIFKV